MKNIQTKTVELVVDKPSEILETNNTKGKGKAKEVESLTPRPKSPSSGSITDYFIERETQYPHDESIEKVVIKDLKDSDLVITETHYKDNVLKLKISEAQDFASSSKLQDNQTEEAETFNFNKAKSKFSKLFDAINFRRDDSHIQKVEPSTDDKLTSLIEDAKVLSDQEILEKVKDTFSDNQESSSNIPPEEQPVESTSKLTEDDKPGVSELFKQIKSNRKEYGTPIIETREELLKQVESHVNSPKVETPSIIVDKEESLPGILESVKGLNRQNTGGKESLFNVGLSPRLEKSPSLHRAPSISNLFDDTQNLFVDEDSIENQTNVELPNWGNANAKIDSEYLSIDFGDNFSNIKEMHIVYNDGEINRHIIDSTFKNREKFKWSTDKQNLEFVSIQLMDKNNNIHEIFKNPDANILPDFELKHRESIKSFANYIIKE
jgi:hypothetical protein